MKNLKLPDHYLLHLRGLLKNDISSLGRAIRCGATVFESDLKYSKSILRMIDKPITARVFVLGCVCYASSHVDIIGIFDNKELADQECLRLNNEYKSSSDGCKQTAEAWGDCYYVYEEDVSEFREWDDNNGFREWLALYKVPSLGEFTIYPKDCMAIDTLITNKINE